MLSLGHLYIFELFLCLQLHTNNARSILAYLIIIACFVCLCAVLLTHLQLPLHFSTLDFYLIIIEVPDLLKLLRRCSVEALHSLHYRLFQTKCA